MVRPFRWNCARIGFTLSGTAVGDFVEALDLQHVALARHDLIQDRVDEKAQQ
jgi:hypothetical protein